MPRNMVHPRLKRILSESSSAVSSPPDTTSDPGKPEPESEDQDPEVESLSHSNHRGSDAEREVSNVASFESPGSKMDISDEDADGAPKVKAEDKILGADADASSDTQKPGKEAGNSGKTTPSSTSLTLQPPMHDSTPPGGSTEPSVARDELSQPPPGPSKSISRSTSVYSTRDFKDASPAPPSTSVSANRSPAPPQRPSLKIKLKLGARSSRVASAEPDHEAGDEKPTRGRRGRPRGSGKGKAKVKGKESVSRPLTFTIPPRPRTDPSETSTRPSLSRSQSSQHSSVESEDAEDADAESENENDAHPGRDDQNRLDDDAMDVDLNVPSLHDRLVDDVESEGDGDIPDYEMDGAGDEDSEVLPGGGKSRLTARQAVLASMVGADHVELETSTSSRKKQLTSEEMALRREETARKRKNMSEKKLEDEKTETINRLLKKQSSRSRTKRSTLLNSSVVPTPQSPHSGDEGESDAIQGAPPAPTEQKGATLPGPAWRWVSNRSEIRLGVPSEVLNMGPLARDGTKVDSAQHPAAEPPKPKQLATCNVSGCGARRKYRLVHDFERGACGMEHLQVLTGAV